MLGSHLFGLPKVSQAHLEPVAGGSSGVGVVAPLFSQCFVAWRSLPQARGSECQSFNSPWCFTSAKCGSSVSVSSLIHRAYAVCIYVPVAILYQKSQIDHFLLLTHPGELPMVLQSEDFTQLLSCVA
jgi:hypothetical protein